MSDVPHVEVIEQGEDEPGSQIKNRSLAWWKALVVVAVVGPTLGVLSFIAQNRLTDVWGALANSGTLWLVAAFVVGALMSSNVWAAASGFGTLIGALLGYYVAADKIVHAATMPRVIVFWIGIALVGGPLFGIAGHWWRDPRRWRHVVAAALLGATFAAEGLYSFQHLSFGDPTTGRIEIVIGILAPIILGRSGKDRLYGLLALVPLVLLGVAAYDILVQLLTLTYRRGF